MHLGSIWGASGEHLGFQETMGLQEALGSNYCNTSKQKCKKIYILICLLYDVFLRVGVTKSCKLQNKTLRRKTNASKKET